MRADGPRILVALENYMSHALSDAPLVAETGFGDHHETWAEAHADLASDQIASARGEF